jgi:rod shape-determining protein MreC
VFQRRRARLVLILLIISALVLVTVDFRGGDGGGDGPLDQARGVITSVFRPVQDGVVTLVRPIGNAASSVTDIFSVRSENERLRARIETLSERHRSVTDLERENVELRDLLNIRDRGQLETVAAQTVALGPSNFEWTITIDAGSDDGVERGMPVINGDGLVGRVFQVTPSASRVLLAIDPNFGAAARIARSGETGLVDGRGGDPMLFSPEDPEAPIEVGDELVTSAYDGGAFPGGIPIGAVAEVGETSTRLTREVQVRPFVDFTRLHHVLVVIERPVEDIPELDESDDEVFERPDVDATLEPDEVDAAPEEDDEEEPDDDDGDDEDG